MKIKVVFIDWYQTLSSNRFFDSIQSDEDTLNALQTALFIDNKAILKDWMHGKISKNDVITLMHQSNPNYSETFILNIMQHSCRNMHFDSPLFLPLIKKLRQNGKRVVIATDNMDTFSDFTVPALKLNEIFDHILSSNELGYMKDDILDDKMMFFNEYLQKNNIRPEEAILIDDSVKTTALCQNYGMNSCCVKSPEDVIQILKKIA